MWHDIDIDRLKRIAVQVQVDIVDDALDYEHSRVLKPIFCKDQNLARVRGDGELKLMKLVDDIALAVEKAVVMSRC